MEYNNVINESNNSNDTHGTVFIPNEYFYTTTSSTFINRLLSLNNQQNSSLDILLISPYYEADNYNYTEIPDYNSSTNSAIFDINENNEETHYDLSRAFFPTVNFIEIIFNDYIQNKNKLSNEEYYNNVEKINKILEECPICFNSNETTIKIKKCNHVFCEDCIQKWLKSHKNTCPICRVNVIESKPNNYNDENTSENENGNDENSNE